MTSTQTPEMAERRKKLMIGGGIAVVALAVLGFLVYWFVFRDDAPAAVDSTEAAEARQEALAEAQAEEPEAEEPAAEVVVEEEPAAEADGDISGVWNVDTSIGTFDELCLTEVCDATFVGFRIDEELASIGAKTVVGRTPGVSGTMTIDGTTITGTDILVDMTGLITDDGARNNAIRNQAIETASFPEASFVLTQPIELGSVPGPGEQVQVEATGDLTIHGVTRTETIPLTAELAGDIIVVFGQLGPILLADYDISEPRAAVVLSVEDNAIMELQLFLRRG